jgi:pimeloyl-ACP methyl ester carboxylesterase
MSVFVIAPGAWSSGWAWRKMRPLLRGAGHDVFTTSYTGMGERDHLASRDVNLSLHMQDVVNVLEFEDLTDVILVGHSFGGVVATGVADRARERIARLIYVDAFVPDDGQCLFDLVSSDAQRRLRESCEASDGWRVPPMDMPSDTPPADREWAMPRRRPHPIAAFQEPVRLSGRELPARAYVYCTRIGAVDTFGPFAARARHEGWSYAEIDASHNPHITAPEQLRNVFDVLQRSPANQSPKNQGAF